MYFTGRSGSGHAILVMKDGVIAGADACGITFDGTYKPSGETIHVSLNMTVPPGVTLVTGAVAGQEPMTQELETALPVDFADGNAVPVKTPTGPVNVIFRRIRDAV